ncbi:hypothetical protein [Halobellus sp. EA9]|uniref:hypothetical protein n=1 Tax=Halobellus sp. EA9 TaxID=3421647 RepID=UPI003EB840F9
MLVGADSVFPDGSVVNKTGTRVLALAARSLGVPVYVVASRDKVRPSGAEVSDREAPDERSPADLVYDGDRDVSVHAPTFEVTPGELIDGIATEAGLLSGADVRAVAEEHAENAEWT